MISIEGIRAKWSDYLTTWEDPRDGKPDKLTKCKIMMIKSFLKDLDLIIDGTNKS